MILSSLPFDGAGAQSNDGCEYREQIGPEAEGRTVLSYLSHRYGHSPQAEWRSRIAEGKVLVNGKPILPDDRLKRGSELVWYRPPWTEPAAPLWFKVLYEDADLLAVEKPAGLPTLPGANFLKNTLLHLVRAHAADAAPLHRLGRWTSGLVLCAKDPSGRADLIRQWSGKKVRKRYRALASGHPQQDELSITTPIGPVAHALLGTVHAASPDGKPASSQVTVLELRTGSFLCDVHISTGRPHQIRIHLAAAGHPLVGDPLYGDGGLPRKESRALPGDPGYLLHAAELAFRHPADGREIVILCEPPPILRCSAECPEVR